MRTTLHPAEVPTLSADPGLEPDAGARTPDPLSFQYLRRVSDRALARGQDGAFQMDEEEVMAGVAAGRPLADSLAAIVRLLERELPGHCVALFQLEPLTQQLRLLVSGTLPADFAAAMDGRTAGGAGGVCAAAVAERGLVVVGDLQADPLGLDFRQAAETTGVRSWWSQPILATAGQVFGTLAVVGREAALPTPVEQQLLRRVAVVTSLAWQRAAGESAVRLAEEKYRRAIESALDGMFQVSPEGRVLDANPAFARMFGYATPADMIARIRDVAEQLCLQPARYVELVQTVRSKGEVQRWELPMRGPGGAVLWVSIDARLAQAADGQTLCFEGTARDVTERKRLEQQFLQTQKMEAFGQLAGGVAHDFNNLLTVIMGNLSLLRAGDVPAATAETVMDDCFRAAQRAANLTSQLLTFSRRQPVEPMDLDLNEIVREMAKMLQSMIGEHITLETLLAPEEARVRADSGMMEQILMNLALNSRDAMPRGGRLTIATATANLDAAAALATGKGRPGSFVRLSVHDNGSGILPEHLAHIFEPFFTTKEVGKGTGLGLATVFGIVEQHEGWIDVDSTPQVGTAIHIFLPRIVDGPRRAFAASPTLGLPRGGKERILLVEDEEAVRSLMVRLLERQGYTVFEAANGVDALGLWQRHRDETDLLITDMVMPEGIDGRELAEMLRADRPGLRVIFCSGYSDKMADADARSLNGDLFLEKPFDIHVLLNRVRSCLDQARAAN